MSIGLAMAACLGWGIADFIGGFKSRQIPTPWVLLISNGAGLCLLAVILMVWGRPLVADPNLVWAVPAGVVGMISMYLLYQSLAMGTISILAPISATGVVLPVIWGILNGESLSGLKLAGMASALAGTMMAAMEKDKEKKRMTKGMGHALGAAVCIGVYFIFMDRACETDPLRASLIMRATTVLLLLPLFPAVSSPLSARGGRFPLKGHLALISFMGCMDTLAAFAFALAVQSGMLSIVAMISSLYPAVTIVLSAVIIRERIRGIQAAGVVLALSGVVVISGF